MSNYTMKKEDYIRSFIEYLLPNETDSNKDRLFHILTDVVSFNAFINMRAGDAYKYDRFMRMIESKVHLKENYNFDIGSGNENYKGGKPWIIFLNRCRKALSYLLLIKDEPIMYLFSHSSLKYATFIMDNEILSNEDYANNEESFHVNTRDMMYRRFNLGTTLNKPKDFIISCGNPRFIGKSSKNFKFIMVEVLCISTATHQDVRDKAEEIRDAILKKLEKNKTFKDNPELLKHLRISNMLYSGNGLVIVHLEWKESFAYD